MTEFKKELKSIKNHWGTDYEITHRSKELTFIGVKDQPDFAYIEIRYQPYQELIELKSLKFYYYKFREKLYSYEALVNLIFNDIREIYDPNALEVSIVLNPRGGIESKVRKNSAGIKWI